MIDYSWGLIYLYFFLELGRELLIVAIPIILVAKMIAYESR